MGDFTIRCFMVDVAATLLISSVRFKLPHMRTNCILTCLSRPETTISVKFTTHYQMLRMYVE